MSQDQIRYDVLVQEALKSVVRKVLTEVMQTGLPGEHHFYISFDTQHPGVKISSRLRQRYPDEMTIVLQHQYWDLGVSDTQFEVNLSFGNVPERLVVPFSAVKGFFDPSVQFGLQFEVHREGAEERKEPVIGVPPAQSSGAVRGPVSVTSAAIGDVDTHQDAKPEPKAVPKAEPKPEIAAEAPKAAPEADKQDTAADKPAAATVVSLDAFRKKT
ncbi:MAG: Stringent starvation protein B [Hyphomicrobiaceae bacterium]|nr:Stringent starvation protein B [Hyphomicrobiaceae bacterium]